MISRDRLEWPSLGPRLAGARTQTLLPPPLLLLPTAFACCSMDKTPHCSATVLGKTPPLKCCGNLTLLEGCCSPPALQAGSNGALGQIQPAGHGLPILVLEYFWGLALYAVVQKPSQPYVTISVVCSFAHSYKSDSENGKCFRASNFPSMWVHVYI